MTGVGCKTWWASNLVLGAGYGLVHITVLYLSLIEVLVDPQNHTFEKIRSKVLTQLKISEVPAKRKVFATVLQLLFSLYKWIILPKIPFMIVLKIVEMPLNVEFPTLPLNMLNKNVKFWQHFWAENILKVSLKGKVLDNNLTPFNYPFYVKIRVKCE